MGTSQSSLGPGPGVPLVPPWTPEPPPSDPDDPVAAPTDAPTLAQPPQPLAPPARFRDTRRALGDFARTGDGGKMRRGLGHYVRTGYGGSRGATPRHGGTAVTGGALWTTLAASAAGEPATAQSTIDLALLEAESADDVMDAIVEAVRPVDGTQDAEVERLAIRDALADLLSRYPDAELAHLDADQRCFAIARFTTRSVFGRFELDVGQAIQSRAPNATTALARLQEVRDYVDQTVAASFRSLDLSRRALDGGRLDQILRDALQETFEVFEVYSQ